jgi:dienelactone hydrolase
MKRQELSTGIGMAWASGKRWQIGRGQLAALVAILAAASAPWLTVPLPAAAQRAAPIAAPGKEGEAAPPKKATAPVKPAADIHETVAKVAVTVRLPDGRMHAGEMQITHYRPSGNGPFPVVVFTHGRNSQMRHDPPRWRAVPSARFWTRRGFAVFVMTRVGYGELGQHVDPEAGGACSTVDYTPALDAMTTQIERTIAFAAEQPWADAKRVVLHGVSYGGFGTIASIARAPPGVVGAVNFVGGLGGNPQRRPRDPCQGDKITSIAAAAGAKARVPMLWLYAENDAFWGAEWPKRWHKAFTGAGGKAQLTTFGPIGADGHKLLNDGFPQWRPVVDKFIEGLGFKLPVAAPTMKASGFARIEEADKVPHVAPSVRAEGYAKFLAADVPRAFAISPSGAWAWRSGLDAVKVAMERCQIGSRTPCALYAVDDKVVWKAPQK